jgi:hydrogenase expression/formation protein HypC
MGKRDRPDSAPQVASHSCQGDVCITCSDEAVPVRVVELQDDDLALVDTGSTLEQVSVGLVDARVGDQLLVHAKEAIAVLGER